MQVEKIESAIEKLGRTVDAVKICGLTEDFKALQHAWETFKQQNTPASATAMPDIDEIISRLDYDKIVGRLDFKRLQDDLDLHALACEIDLRELSREFNASDIAGELDVGDIAEEVAKNIINDSQMVETVADGITSSLAGKITVTIG